MHQHQLSLLTVCLMGLTLGLICSLAILNTATAWWV